MAKKEKLIPTTFIKIFACVALSLLLGCFFYFYVDSGKGFLQKRRALILPCGFTFIVVITVLNIIASFSKKEVFFKLIFSVVFLFTVVLLFLYLFNSFGFWEKFTSVKTLRDYVEGKGFYALLTIFLLQFLQVIILPIPSLLLTSVSVLLFGTFFGALISFGGIFLGSVTAFFIGRKFGVKAISFIVGKNSFTKYRKIFQGKDEFVLTVSFLLPFFPDDLLCFIAGLSSISKKRFIITIAITRFISVYVTAYSVSGKLLPYDTPLGVSVWIILILTFLLISSVIYENYYKRVKR